MFTKTLSKTVLALAIGTASLGAFAQVMVGGAPMLASKDIIDNAVNSKDHTTLVAAVKAAGLVDTLASPGPFTVFAPTNAAFANARPSESTQCANQLPLPATFCATFLFDRSNQRRRRSRRLRVNPIGITHACPAPTAQPQHQTPLKWDR